MAIKVNIGVPSAKRTKQIELSEEQSKSLYEKRLGDTIKGELIDLPGYQFEITGGSDNAGFPMRRDVSVSGRKKILIVRGPGNRDARKGRRLRKTVAGAIIYQGTAQVNLKAIKEGSQSLFEEPKTEEPATEKAPEEKPKEPKAEEKAEKPEEKPKAEKAEKPEQPSEADEKPVEKPEEKGSEEKKDAS